MKFYLVNKLGELMYTWSDKEVGLSRKQVVMTFPTLAEAIKWATDNHATCTVVTLHPVATVTHEIAHRVLVHPLD